MWNHLTLKLNVISPPSNRPTRFLLSCPRVCSWPSRSTSEKLSLPGSLLSLKKKKNQASVTRATSWSQSTPPHSFQVLSEKQNLRNRTAWTQYSCCACRLGSSEGPCYNPLFCKMFFVSPQWNCFVWTKMMLISLEALCIIWYSNRHSSLLSQYKYWIPFQIYLTYWNHIIGTF